MAWFAAALASVAWPQGRARMMAGVYAQVVNVLVVAQVYRRLRSWISMA